MVIAVTFKQGVIIPQEKPFQLDQFQCQMVIHFEVVLFEITKWLVLLCTTVYI